MSNNNISKGSTIFLGPSSSSNGSTEVVTDCGPTYVVNNAGPTAVTQVVGEDVSSKIQLPLSKHTVLVANGGNKLCVGWLLVIDGPCKGMSREIYAGSQLVGRDTSAGAIFGIDIPGDESVSRIQCELTYDEKRNRYVLSKAAASTAITEVDGEPLYAGQTAFLKHGSIIALSEKTILRFIPACDAEFDWK